MGTTKTSLEEYLSMSHRAHLLRFAAKQNLFCLRKILH
jgi:hypothetical protein